MPSDPLDTASASGSPGQSVLVALWRGPQRDEADRLALVLAAVGIPCFVALAAGEWVLLVPRERAAAARAQLDAFRAENAGGTPGPSAAPATEPVGNALTGLLAATAVLLFLDAAAGKRLFGLDWWAAGVADSAAVLRGEIWRVVTALGLHAGFDHLGGNLVFGALFVGLLAATVGNGVAWLATLVAGSAGNLLNALWRGAGHASVGASTAVFGALGMLALLAWRDRRGMRGLRRLAPLGGGVLLLAWLGLAGERTDIGAHLLGFAGGAALAPVLARLPAHLLADDRFQIACGAAAALLFALAWAVGLALAG